MTTRFAVTGGAGFLGSHVADHFVDVEDDVVVVDDLSSGHADHVPDEADLREADLTDADEADAALADVDVVVHLAAKIGGIGYFHHVPADIIALNDAMNRHVFDAAVDHDIDRVVYASSSMVYENATEFPVTEDQLGEIPPPDSAYGFQKLAGEYYCEAYRDQYDVDYSVFRPFNAVGTREPPGDEVGQAHVIPDFVKKILEEEQDPVELLGDGRQIRAFTNVRDIARGVHACATRDAALNDGFNLGSADGIEMRDLARTVWDLCDREGEISFAFEEAFEHDVQKRVPSSAKARETLGWEPEVDLDRSLAEYVSWYREVVL
jgi:nucleoside-diphosphate-sugar epimerase